ncbi:hypothetical protein NPIL_158571 [Nephila pilipes]|uniref:Uncharacterized protein n=1 Tax=Nephila pilipes TaxID=299642 RepID=A0A8X6TD44_NEPPI|nr:hypothetical protein NPIL_158571 [Nephila pilipes]
MRGHITGQLRRTTRDEVHATESLTHGPNGAQLLTTSGWAAHSDPSPWSTVGIVSSQDIKPSDIHPERCITVRAHMGGSGIPLLGVLVTWWPYEPQPQPWLKPPLPTSLTGR